MFASDHSRLVLVATRKRRGYARAMNCSAANRTSPSRSRWNRRTTASPSAPWLVLFIFAAACHKDGSNPPEPVDSGTASAQTCVNATQCSSGTEYCYSGSETGFYEGSDSVHIGCNEIPAACAADHSCACMFAFYPEGFCSCSASDGLTLSCSFI